MKKKVFAAVFLILALSACSGKDAEPAPDNGQDIVRIGSLKGPTTLGLLSMMEKGEKGELPFKAEFRMAVTADELGAGLVSGDLDIALIPANLASVLYSRTKAEVSVIDINTGGALSFVTGDPSVKELKDLRGRKLLLTGQGTTPEFVLRYVLDECGYTDDVELDFRNEATEIAALMKADPSGIALLPQPFATVCCMQSPEVHEFLSMSDEWDRLSSDGSRMITGVTVAGKKFAENHEEDGLIRTFLEEHEKSAGSIENDPVRAAVLAVKYGIIEKQPVAEAAVGKCGVTFISGEEMIKALKGYLKVLFEADPSSVGGSLPDDDFYTVIAD